MNKKHIAIIVIAAIILAVIIGLVITNYAKAPEVPTGGNSTSTMQQSTSTASSSMTNSSGTVSVTIQKMYSGPSFSLSYPTSWTVIRQLPFSVDNFNGAYLSGGIIPVGGAEIDISTTSVDGAPTGIIQTELMGTLDVVSSTITVNGVTCQKESFRANYGDAATSQDIALYCLRGTELWKIYFSYPAGDPHGASLVSAFDDILSSMKLK